MPSFPHRPRIELIASPQLFLTGEECDLTVRVHAKRDTLILGISAWLSGFEEARYKNMGSVRRVQIDGRGDVVEVLGACRICSGISEFTFQLRIPTEFSPSYLGKRCLSRYALHLQMRLPWWLGRKTRRAVQIEMGIPLATHPGQASLFFSHSSEEPEAKKAYFEISIANDVVVPGEFLQGAVALLNTKFNRYTRIHISLVGKEILHTTREREKVEVRRLSMIINTHDPAEGERFEIDMQVPNDIAPSASARVWSLSWELEVVASIRFGRDVSVRLPIVVVPRRFAGASTLFRQPPSVGADRIAALWSSVSEEFGFEFVDGQLRCQRVGVSISITRQHKGRAGLALVANLQFSSLGLGVTIRHGSRLRSLGGLAIGYESWDMAHYICGRDDQQTQAFLSQVAQSLVRFTSVHFDDGSAQLSCADSGTNRKQLAAYVASVLELATDIMTARSQIPIPACFATASEEWRQFADTLGGTLERGDMSIHGHFQGVGVEISHTWGTDGALIESSIRLHGLNRITANECFEVRAASGAGSSAGISRDELNSTSSRDRASLLSWLPGALRFSCQLDQLQLVVKPATNPEMLEEYLGCLAEFSRLRVQQSGPYR